MTMEIAMQTFSLMCVCVCLMMFSFVYVTRFVVFYNFVLCLVHIGNYKIRLLFKMTSSINNGNKLYIFISQNYSF